jgi:hypothetical protein
MLKRVGGREWEVGKYFLVSSPLLTSRKRKVLFNTALFRTFERIYFIAGLVLKVLAASIKF